MSATATGGLGAGQPVVRPVGGFSGALLRWGLEHSGFFLGLLREWAPLPVVRGTAIVTRYDDVRTVFLSDEAFMVPYAKKLDVIMGGAPFFLGMGNTDAYRRDTAAMRKVVRIDDVLQRLGPAAALAAERRVASAGGSIEVVGDLVRAVTFEVLLDYFGIPAPETGDLRVWATRLFEYQFANDDAAFARDIEKDYAPALRAHVTREINARRDAGSTGDDVLGRCLQRQANGEDGFTDEKIRCALVGFIVGGLPQPPMVGPQALEQLLRRPEALAGAQSAARSGDDALLAAYIFEAMRFDPLAPFLSRTVVKDTTLGAGTSHAKRLKVGTKVLVSFASAMMDGRRIKDPRTFDPHRPATNYLHFGQGLHECFGIHINRVLLPQILKPLLKRTGLARAPGAAGRLVKQGPFAERLTVRFGA